MILSVKTRKKTELIDITSDINKQIQNSGIDQGLCMLYVPHTTAAVTINESADPSVKSDILMILNQIIPWEANYRHLEGNSPAHIKSTLVGSSELISIENRRLHRKWDFSSARVPFPGRIHHRAQDSPILRSDRSALSKLYLA